MDGGEWREEGGRGGRKGGKEGRREGGREGGRGGREGRDGGREGITYIHIMGRRESSDMNVGFRQHRPSLHSLVTA